MYSIVYLLLYIYIHTLYNINLNDNIIQTEHFVTICIAVFIAIYTTLLYTIVYIHTYIYERTVPSQVSLDQLLHTHRTHLSEEPRVHTLSLRVPHHTRPHAFILGQLALLLLQ